MPPNRNHYHKETSQPINIVNHWTGFQLMRVNIEQIKR